MKWLEKLRSFALIQRLAAERQEAKRRRYEHNKLAKIARLSEKYGIRKPPCYAFSPEGSKTKYLEGLKAGIIENRVSMLGEHKLDTLRFCIETCLAEGIEGDLIETGVWKGGATIYMAGVLKAYGENARKVFVADSFAGLPPPDEARWPQDKGDTHHTREHLAISLAQVRDNFKSFDLLAGNVIFVQGFFEDSLKTAPIDKLAVLRLDGDMYGSTMTVLQQLYHKLEVGGFLILDDWLLKGAREALLDFRAAMGIGEEMYEDFSGVFWRKEQATPAADQAAHGATAPKDRF